MSWTDERISTLKKMWQQGKSASEIAEKLGGVTRNAVIGKAHRLGLSGRPSPIKKVVKKAAPAPAKKAPPVAPKASAPVAKPAAPAKQPSATAAPSAKALPKASSATIPTKPVEAAPLAALANATSRSDGKIISILELTEKNCRWPVGDPKDPGFGYCGAGVYQNHPYCAEHVAIAFQAPNRKENKRPMKDLKVAEAPELEDLEIEVEIDDEAIEDETLEDDLDEDDPNVSVV